MTEIQKSKQCLALKSFGEMDDTIIILLNGGAKKSQKKDIKKAKAYWKEYIFRRLT